MSEFKRDVVIESRLSSIDLANCAKYLISKNIIPRNNSDLLHLITQMASYSTKQEDILSVTDARAFLDSIGLGNLNRKDRNIRIAIRAMQEDTLEADGFDKAYGTKNGAKHGDEDWEQLAKQALGIDKKEINSMVTEDVIKSILESKKTMNVVE